MLRTIIFLGIAILILSAVIGLSLGIIGFVIRIGFQILILGAIAYFLIRIFSPSTIERLKAKLH